MNRRIAIHHLQKQGWKQSVKELRQFEHKKLKMAAETSAAKADELTKGGENVVLWVGSPFKAS